MKITLTILFLYTTLILFSQNISKKDVLSDLNFLNAAVSSGHPVNYLEKGKYNITKLISSIEKQEKDSFSVVNYRFILGSALQQIGCVHTSIIKNPLIKKTGNESFFPLKVLILNQKLYFSKQNDSLSKIELYKGLEGQEIKSINAVSSEKIISDLMNYSASDGINKNFVLEHVNFIMPSILAYYFSYPTSFEINLDNEKISLDASITNISKTKIDKKITYLLSNNKNHFYYENKVAVLKLASFSNSDILFFNKVFDLIEKENASEFILDLRGNGGGSRKSAIELTKHLVNSKFSYSILQCKLETKKFLDKKGKRFLFLSKLKYNVGDIFKGRKTPLGREFTYKFNPDKNSFTETVYVITDGFTASSATMACSWLKQYSKSIFVGNQSGGGYNGNNGGSFPSITLPASKIQVKFPAYRLILDKNSSQNAGIIPDYQINYTIDEVISGKDKEMEFIFEKIKR